MLPLPVGEGWGEGSKRLKNRLLIHQYYCLPPPRPSPAAGFALRGRGNSWAVSVLFHYTYTSSAQVYVKPYKTKSLHGESSSGNIFLLSICKEYTMTYPPAIEKALAYLQEKNIISFHRESVLHKILWRCDIAIPPPILASITINVITGGINTSIRLVPIMLIFIYGFNVHASAGLWIFIFVFNAIFWGLFLALLERYARRKFALLSWQEIQNLPDEKP